MFLDTLLESFRQTSRKTDTVQPKPRKKSPPSIGNDALIAAIWAHSPTGLHGLCISDLAKAMGCSVGESSKRVRAAGRLVKITKQGRRKIVTINHDLPVEEWDRLR